MDSIMIKDTTWNIDSVLPHADEIREASNNGIIDAVCEYAYELSKREWHYIKFSFFAPYTQKCPICSGRKEGKRYGSNCICIPFACWKHGGHIPCHCSTHVINDSNWNRIAVLPDHEAALEIARRRIGVRDIMLIRGDNVRNSLKRGDACAHFSGGRYIHTSLYLGEGKMLDCSLEKMHIAVRDAMESEYAIRYTGGRDYLTAGDSGIAVAKVQTFLNRYFSDSKDPEPLETDGRFGLRTKEAVMLFQSRNCMESDGNVGSRTIAAMRECL